MNFLNSKQNKNLNSFLKNYFDINSNFKRQNISKTSLLRGCLKSTLGVMLRNEASQYVPKILDSIALRAYAPQTFQFLRFSIDDPQNDNLYLLRLFKHPLRAAILFSLFFSLFPNIKAVGENSSNDKSINQAILNSNTLPQQKACTSPSSQPQKTFETAKYYVYICAGDKENNRGYYIAVSKMGATTINLPIARQNGESYIAAKGLLVYSISPYELLITKKRRIIHKEKVNSAIKEDGKSIARGCPDRQHIFTSAETRNYIIYICGEKTPTSYVSLAKDGNESVTLPLQSENNSKENQYIAIDGNTHYFLSRNALRVSTQGLTIIKERILQWD
jgi:hypothetical protein